MKTEGNASPSLLFLLILFFLLPIEPVIPAEPSPEPPKGKQWTVTPIPWEKKEAILGLTGEPPFGLTASPEGEIMLLHSRGFLPVTENLEISEAAPSLEYDQQRYPWEAPPAGAAFFQGNWELISNQGEWRRGNPSEGFTARGTLPAAEGDVLALGGPGHVYRLRQNELSLWGPLTETPEAPRRTWTLRGFPGVLATAPGETGDTGLAVTADSLAPGLTLIRKNETAAVNLPRSFFPGPIQTLVFCGPEELAAGGASPRGSYLTGFRLKYPSGQKTKRPQVEILYHTTRLNDKPLPFSFQLAASRDTLYLLDQTEPQIILLRTENTTAPPAEVPDTPWEYQFCQAALNLTDTIFPGETNPGNISLDTLKRADRILSWIEGFLRRKHSEEPLNPLWRESLDELKARKKAVREALENISSFPSEG